MKRQLSFILVGICILFVIGCGDTKPSSSSSSGQGGGSGSSAELKGKILYVSKGNIWVWDNGALKQLTKGGSDTHPAWSPDGSAIAYINKSQSYSDLMLMSAVSGDFKQLTTDKAPSVAGSVWAYRPTFTPDGKKINFLSDAFTDGLALWEIGVDGKNKQRVTALNVNYGGLESPTWSPDGKTVALTAFRDSISQIWLFTPANGKWVQVTREKQGAYDSRWSPGGSKIAFTARDSGTHDVKVINPDGSGLTEVTTDGLSRAPVWSADSKYLAYISGRGGSFDVWAVRVQTLPSGEFSIGEPRQLTKNQNVDPGSGLSWRP